MRYFVAVLLAVSWLASISIPQAQAESVASRVAGHILLDVEAHGEAWYVSPPTLERYYLKDGPAAYEAMRMFGLGINETDYASLVAGNDALIDRLRGRIILRVHAHGEAYYIHPDGSLHYLANGEAAYAIMSLLSLGITSAALAQIPIAAGSPLPIGAETLTYRAYTLATADGNFSVHVATLPRSSFTLVTDTLATADCEDDCPVQSLANYVIDQGAVAGMHGTYMCPADYPSCEDKLNTFLPPVFNSELGLMINDDTLRFHNRPLAVQTTDGQLHFFRSATEFGDSLADYENRTGLTVSAAIGNWPALVDNGAIVIADEPSEASFETLGTRGGFGWDDNNFYLVIASGATVSNLATIFATLGADYALNLDGGSTAALYIDGMYKVGPGRPLPNAILLKRK